MLRSALQAKTGVAASFPFPAHAVRERPRRPAEKQRSKHVSKKLFVGGLAWATTAEGLQSAFEKFGPVREAKVIMDRDTGRSRGFGFVTYDSNDDGDKAMQEMDGAELDGRRIRVNEAEERQRGGGGGGRGGPPGGGRGGRGGRDRGDRGGRY